MSIKRLFIQFVKFGLVGVSNTAISYGVYAFFTYLGVQYIIANVAGFVVSVLNSFFWNNRYVFKKEKDEKRNLWWTLLKTFLAYAGTGLIIANILLFLFVEKLCLSKYIAPIFSLVITIPLNFIINKLWTFKATKMYNGKSDELKENEK